MVGGQWGWVEITQRKAARNYNLLWVAWQIFCAEMFTEIRAGGILSSWCLFFIFLQKSLLKIQPRCKTCHNSVLQKLLLRCDSGICL